jgi:hypothetical protein
MFVIQNIMLTIWKNPCRIDVSNLEWVLSPKVSFQLHKKTADMATLFTSLHNLLLKRVKFWWTLNNRSQLWIVHHLFRSVRTLHKILILYSYFSFGLSGIAWSGGSHFWPNWNGLEWRKSVLAGLEWLGMEEVSFGLPRIARNRRNWFWTDWNSLEWSNLGLVPQFF